MTLLRNVASLENWESRPLAAAAVAWCRPAGTVDPYITTLLHVLTSHHLS